MRFFISSIISAVLALATCVHAGLPEGVPKPTAAQLQEYATALSLHLVNHITAIIDPSALITNQAYVDFVALNPVPIPINVTHISARAGQNGTTYASFSQSFTNFTIASNTTADSGTFGGVSLTQGALGSIGLLGSNYIDLQSANISVLIYNYIPLNLTDITQNNVSAAFNITI